MNIITEQGSDCHLPSIALRDSFEIDLNQSWFQLSVKLRFDLLSLAILNHENRDSHPL